MTRFGVIPGSRISCAVLDLNIKNRSAFVPVVGAAKYFQRGRWSDA